MSEHAKHTAGVAEEAVAFEPNKAAVTRRSEGEQPAFGARESARSTLRRFPKIMAKLAE